MQGTVSMVYRSMMYYQVGLHVFCDLYSVITGPGAQNIPLPTNLLITDACIIIFSRYTNLLAVQNLALKECDSVCIF